jgi:hypothetical protein
MEYNKLAWILFYSCLISQTFLINTAMRTLSLIAIAIIASGVLLSFKKKSSSDDSLGV